MAYTGLKTGPISSYTALAANQMPYNDRLLYLLYPFQYPLFQKMYFSSGRRAEAVTNDKGLFSWFEDELYPNTTTVSVAVTGGSTIQLYGYVTLNFFQASDELLFEETGEMGYVSTKDSTHVTVTPLGGSTLTGLSVGCVIRKVGTLDHEYAGVRTVVSTQEIQVSNYLTKFNESVGMTGRQQASKTYTNGKSFKEQLSKKIDEMKLLYENNFKFSTQSGIATVSGSDGNSYYATYGKGLYGMITTNVFTYTTLNETVVDQFMAAIFSTGGSAVKDFYQGVDQSLAFAKIIKDKFQINPQGIVTQYGVRLTRYTLTQGTLNLIWDPTMNQGFVDWGFAVDPDANKPAKMMYMADDDKGSRKFRVEKHVETPGSDGRVDKLLADIGLQIPNQEIDGILKAATA